ncbi:hypothetical protein ACP275_04G089700 [Erythranthe tilingii]
MAETINKCRRIHVKLIFLLFIFLIVHAGGANQRQTESAQSRMSVIDAAKTLFSLPTTISPFTWFHKLKSLFIQPPNLDFRGGGGGGGGSEGAAEKVKEAVVKSLDTSKSTVEESAKTAAELAEEAVGKTVNKLSGKGEQHHTAHREPEL